LPPLPSNSSIFGIKARYNDASFDSKFRENEEINITDDDERPLVHANSLV